MKKDKICLISFSNNTDHQNTLYSMFNALNNKYDVYTIGITNPKTKIAPKTQKNFYVNCPLRPGICKGTFNIKLIHEIRKIIKENDIKYLYFESQHLWNLFIMMFMHKRTKIVAVHDVIPHDGNIFMILSNFVTCHMAKHIILRNYMYKDTLSKKYKIPLKKITCFELWRDFPEKSEITYSKQFLYFGRIRKYKGMDLFEKIAKLTPEIKYRVVGSPDEESKYMVENIKKYSNIEVIDREVSEDEMKKYFYEADWLVLPYSSATQSGVITDACRFSRPSIAFDVGAIKEQIINNETGFLIEEGNIKEFVKKIKEANSMNNDKLKEFSDKAYEFGYNKYSAEAHADEFYKLIQSI